MPWPIARACYEYLSYLLLDLFKTASNFFYRIRQSVFELCNQAKEDLVEEAGGSTCDKGIETGV